MSQSSDETVTAKSEPAPKDGKHLGSTHEASSTDAHQITSSQAFKWIWLAYLKPYKLTLFFALVLMVIEGSMLGCISWLLQPMFDDVFAQGEASALTWIGVAIFSVFLVRAISSTGHRVLLAKAGQSASADLRRDLLSHLMVLESAYHQRHAPGQTIERVQSDVSAAVETWIGVFVGIGRDLVAVLVLFGVAIDVDLVWTMIALIGAPVLVIPALIAQAYIRKRSGHARDLAARMSTQLDEVLHGINSIKLNTLELYQIKRYTGLSTARVRAEVKAAAGHAAVPALTDIMTGFGFFAVIVFGGGEILAGEKTVGQFMSFFTAMSLTFGPIRKLGALGGQWQIAVASIERIQAILKRQPAITSPAQPISAAHELQDIRFENVSLEYNGVPALHDISFTAPKGKTTAFVGSSGAGKSTIFNVLTRLVDPQSGAIYIGDTPIDRLDLPQLRGLFSTVSQDTALFDESLKDNILLGRTQVDEHSLEEVLKASHVDGFVEQLPMGLDSPSGPRGSNLSGGQRQRIAIARALLRNTPFLLLDEATSALDTKSETFVQNALETLSQGRTTLVIAHRLSTIRNADQIIVMDQGRIIDSGTHDTLLSHRGLYSELYKLQFGQKGDE